MIFDILSFSTYITEVINTINQNKIVMIILFVASVFGAIEYPFRIFEKLMQFVNPNTDTPNNTKNRCSYWLNISLFSNDIFLVNTKFFLVCHYDNILLICDNFFFLSYIPL
jgi:hypothetical protein